MLTVSDSEADKIEALDAGADDYITKPFSIPELTARLRSAVRRSNTAANDRAGAIHRHRRDRTRSFDRRTCAKRGSLLAADAQGVRSCCTT
jgi:DNA-binding response OmpR family regulator